MEIKGDHIRIDTSPRDAEGKQLDPAEKPAAHELILDIPLTSNALGGAPNVLGHLQRPGIIQEVGTVAQFAHDVQHTCGLCRWFDNEKWLQTKANMAASQDPKDFKALGQIRASFMDTFTGLPPNHPRIEAAMNTLGICHALSAFWDDAVITSPEAGCTSDPGPKGENLTKLFEPRSTESEKVATGLYDALMRAAQGTN